MDALLYITFISKSKSLFSCLVQILLRTIVQSPIINKIVFKAIPHNSKCRYGERGAADAKPKAQIILDAAKVSAASGRCSEPKQGQRSQSARGFCPRSTMRVPQPDIIEHFGNADAVPQPPKRCLGRQAGIVPCCPWNPQRIPAAPCLTSCLCLRNVRHFPCFQIRLENQSTMNKEGIL